MSTIQKKMTDKLRTSEGKQKILFLDGSDKRAIEAAISHKELDVIEPILLLEKTNDDLEGKVSTIIIENFNDKIDELVNKYVEKRKGKETVEEAKNVVFQPPIFAMLMLELGYVDGVIAGLINPTSDILKAAFKVIGAKKDTKTISSVMLMERQEELYVFGDISVNIDPTSSQLSDIAFNAYDFAKSMDIESKIAFLSFSTDGSAVHEKSELVVEATRMFNEKHKLDVPAIGEVQFDAAFDETVRKAKYNNDSFDGAASVFIFPNLNAGNIGYKIAQRLGGFGAIGPIITGLQRPVNDLSRGATVEDIFNTALITAVQSK